MQAFNFLKRIFGREPQYLVSNSGVEQRPKEYTDMISELSDKLPRDGDLDVARCNSDGLDFNQEEFISLVLNDKTQTIDFFRKYFYVGNTRANKLDENLLDFRLFADDLINSPPYKWVYINDLIDNMVSDQRFKNMQLGSQITQIVFNKEWDEMIGKIEQAHTLSAISSMVQCNIFDVEELRKISKEVAGGYYNTANQEKLRDNLIGKANIQIQKKLLEESVEGLGIETEAPKRKI